MATLACGCTERGRTGLGPQAPSVATLVSQSSGPVSPCAGSRVSPGLSPCLPASLCLEGLSPVLPQDKHPSPGGQNRRGVTHSQQSYYDGLANVTAKKRTPVLCPALTVPPTLHPGERLPSTSSWTRTEP